MGKRRQQPDVRGYTVIIRAFFNQPSKHQPHHDKHGINVLAQDDQGNARVYFLSGPTVSMSVNWDTLSVGWTGVPK